MQRTRYFRRLALFHRALSNERRLFLLAVLLRSKELTVEDCVDLLRVREPSASRHLHILLRAGLITSARRGRKVYFRLLDRALVKKLLRDVKKLAIVE